MENHNTGTILFHQGFTDIINCLPLVNIFSKKFEKINLLMRNDFKEIIDFYTKMQERWGEKLPDPEVYPASFSYYIKLYKFLQVNNLL